MGKSYKNQRIKEMWGAGWDDYLERRERMDFINKAQPLAESGFCLWLSSADAGFGLKGLRHWQSLLL